MDSAPSKLRPVSSASMTCKKLRSRLDAMVSRPASAPDSFSSTSEAFINSSKGVRPNSLSSFFWRVACAGFSLRFFSSKRKNWAARRASSRVSRNSLAG